MYVDEEIAKKVRKLTVEELYEYIGMKKKGIHRLLLSTPIPVHMQDMHLHNQHTDCFTKLVLRICETGSPRIELVTRANTCWPRSQWHQSSWVFAPVNRKALTARPLEKS